MTARADCHQRNLNGAYILIVPAIIIVALFAALSLRPSTHALEKHTEAQAIHETLECDGPSEVWRMTSWKRPGQYILGCQLDDGRWALSLGTVKRGLLGVTFKEITSFVVKGGSRFEFVEYVSARAEFAGQSLKEAMR